MKQKNASPKAREILFRQLVRVYENMPELDGEDKRTQRLVELLSITREQYPAEKFTLNYGQEILFAGKNMILCERGGGAIHFPYSSSGRLKPSGLLVFTGDKSLDVHRWSGMDMVLEGALEKIDASQLCVKQIRKPGTLRRQTFARGESTDVPPRQADLGLTQQEGVYLQIYRAVLGELSQIDLSGKNILDAGCGKGLLIKKIVEAHPEANVYGVEYLSDNVKIAQGRLREANLKVHGDSKTTEVTRRIRQGDARDLHAVFGKRCEFDVIVSTGLISHQASSRADALKIISEWADVMPSGGTMIASGYTPIILEPRDFGFAGFRLKKLCIPQNLFRMNEPKEFFVGERQ